ncbi:MAG: molybdate ABC transporter substrate-binding protein [Thiohalomonas sp.]|nr:molybdate ABC transporter substrate-binding protein [Thiohalomonas sp.]
MKKIQHLFLCAAVLILTIATNNILADDIRVAVASNFSDTIKLIIERFEDKTGHKVILSVGSTGKHYAQIINGAPFELFFAADMRRPELLDKEGLIISGSRFTYAIGKVVLWSPEVNFVDASGDVLKQGKFRFLALANPKLAPYGKGAQQALQQRGDWHGLRKRMVRGENIGQAYQFVKSGNAQLGFVALSHIKRPDKPIEGSFWLVPESLYDPIEQQAVLLKDNDTARDFLDFVKNDETQTIIKGFGYGVP